ncbi:hypothetical protein ACHWQZ_G015446 [Mnemiopsis leidyi]
MIRVCLFLLPLFSLSLSLTCYKCAAFDMTGMSMDQKESMNAVMKMLGTPKCETTTEDVTTVCLAGQDECHKITVNSRLGGDTMYSGDLVQCGESSKRAGLCDSYKSLAGLAGFEIERCRIESCYDDNCFNPNSGVKFHYNVFILISSVLTFLIATL